MRQKINKRSVEYRDPIALLDSPNNIEVYLTWYQNSTCLKSTSNLTYHLMVDYDTIIALANLTYTETDTYKLHPSEEKVLMNL